MEQTSFAESQSQPTSTSTESYSAPAERMVPQSKVDEIVRSATGRVAEKVKRETEESLRAQYVQPTSPHVPTSPGLSPEELKSQVVTEVLQAFQHQAAHHTGQQILNTFQSKLDAARTEDPDIDSIYSLPLANMANTVRFASELDNTAAVMKEIKNNPGHIAQIEELSRIDPSGQLARSRMKQLSESIRINEEAKKVKTANPPLSQLQPSPTGLDNGSPTLTDLKRRYRG